MKTISERIESYLGKKINEDKIPGQKTIDEYVSEFSMKASDMSNFVKSLPKSFENGVYQMPKFLENWGEFKKIVAEIDAKVTSKKVSVGN